MELRFGVDEALETEADLILAADRKTYRDTTKGVRGVGQMLVHGILTDEQLQLRDRHEVYAIGRRSVVDGAHGRGIYRRAHNPLANSRPTCRRRFSHAQDPWRQDYYEFSDDDVASTWNPSARREEVIGGQNYVSMSPRDPAWAYYGTDRDLGDLPWWQFNKIHHAMARVPRRNLFLRRLLREVLAVQYDVPTWMIARIERKPSPQNYV